MTQSTINLILGTLMTVQGGIIIWIFQDYLRFRFNFTKNMGDQFTTKNHCSLQISHCKELQNQRFESIEKKQDESKKILDKIYRHVAKDGME